LVDDDASFTPEYQKIVPANASSTGDDAAA
jgi:hypothetical protein